MGEKKPTKCQQAKYKIYRPNRFQKSQIWVIWPRKMPNGNPAANDAVAAVDRLTACIADINDWMKASRLRLNPCLLYTSDAADE